MIHLGYIIQTVKGPSFNTCGEHFGEQPRICVLIDTCGIAHYFLSENEKFKEGCWITYEGEDLEALDPILTDDYSINYHACHSIDIDKTGKPIIFAKSKPNPMQLCSCGYIIDKNCIKTNTTANETYVLDCLFRKEIIAPKKIPKDSLDEFEKIVKQFLEQAKYVNLHKQEIAESFTLEYKVHIYRKIGDDDELCVYRCAAISHEDPYLNVFFHLGETVVMDEGRYGNYDHPFSPKRAKQEEMEARKKFLTEYDVTRHFSYLLYDYQNNKQIEIERIQKENELLLKKWNVNLKILFQRYDGRYSGVSSFIREIMLYNKNRQRNIS